MMCVCVCALTHVDVHTRGTRRERTLGWDLRLCHFLRKSETKYFPRPALWNFFIHPPPSIGEELGSDLQDVFVKREKEMSIERYKKKSEEILERMGLLSHSSSSGFRTEVSFCVLI